MFRRLWFDLHTTVLHAEHAITRAAHHLTQPVAVEPALILRDGPSPLLASNGIPILAATAPAPAVHTDTTTDDTVNTGRTDVGTADALNDGVDATTVAGAAAASAASTVRTVRLPLQARSALTAEPLRDVLRRGAHAGHAWFTVDIDPAGLRTLATRAVRDSAPPASATWRDAVISHDLQGRYRGQTCPGYQVHGGAPARFRTEVMYQLLADSLCSHSPNRVVTTIFDGGQPWLADDLGDRTPVTADADGWWPITHPALCWTVSLDGENDGTGPAPVFEPHGVDGAGLRCGVCGAVDEVDFREMPSMVGYGLDTAITCTVCGSWDGCDPMFGERAHPKPWPPQPGASTPGARPGTKPSGQEPPA